MKAAVFIDVQNDFIDGALGVDTLKKVSKNIIEFAKECRSFGHALYATRDIHFKTEYDANGNPIKGYLATLEGKKLPKEHCIDGTVGSWIVNGLEEDNNGNVIIPRGHIATKFTFGSDSLVQMLGRDFSDGVLDEDLGVLQEPLKEIYICGFCTDVCVVSNALMLRERFPNVKITVIANLCSGTSPKKHLEALSVMDSCQIDLKEWIDGAGFFDFEFNQPMTKG